MDAITARKARVAALKGQVDARLLELVPPTGRPLSAAMHHALSTPGKRLRPLLLLLTAAQFDQGVEAGLDIACAVEMVHAASLVLDDLPCMDDAPLRRGQPSTHVRFGEDVAVLTGVALLNQAYALLARAGHIASSDRVRMIEALSDAVGMDGLVAGQALDLRAPASDLSALREAHHRKTGVLFMAAVGLAAVMGGARASEHLALERFAAELGLAFQAHDDVSDAAEASGAEAGGAEAGGAVGRCTLISLLGRDGALGEADGRLAAAKRALASGGVRLEPLCGYVDLLLGERERVAEVAA